MPRIKSAEKRVQVAERNRQRNMAYKSAIRTSIKRVLTLHQSGSTTEQLKEAISKAYSLLDRAVTKGVLHKNTVSRYKSRLVKRVAS